ncbi:FMRFamide receptor-like [Haliotis rubra]|uniref:FMRFamide receptor-like n=1 Tax=Haliotis rubra TaxID=36100 RepID=UPI001EE5EDD8|nr:FMRFamide receptor-like [Haliotis rubra]
MEDVTYLPLNTSLVDEFLYYDDANSSTNMIQSTDPANETALEITRCIIQKVCVPVVVALGFLGNVLNMVVLTRRSMKSSTNCYLTALAAFDSLYLVFSLTLSFKHYEPFRHMLSYMHWYRVCRVLSDMSANVSVFLTVTFTVERYIGVCHPMRGRTLCTVQRAKVIIVLVALVAMACTTPEFFEMKVINEIKNNVTVPTVRYTDFSKTYSYKIGYYWFFVTIFTFLPLLLLCVFNGILISSVVKAVEIRRRMTSLSPHRISSSRHSGEQQKITKMLITVVLVFLLCQIPGAVLMMYSTYLELAEVSLSKSMRNDLKIAANFTNFLIQINASINFILYSLISTKFRRVFYRTVCTKSKKYASKAYSKNSEFSAMTTYRLGSLHSVREPVYHLAGCRKIGDASSMCQQNLTQYEDGSLQDIRQTSNM